jgi:hypothetical protein
MESERVKMGLVLVAAAAAADDDDNGRIKGWTAFRRLGLSQS